VPSELLYRRSDIASAYAQMVQSAAKAKMARIARLPTLSLTAEGGVVSSELSGILKGENWGWSALLSFAQPIYRFGALKGAEKAAVESYNQALYYYRQSFITALMDVENALVAIRTTREQAERYKSLIEANRRIATLSVALYKSGLSSYLEVIDAERTLYDAQMQYSNIIASQYIAYIELFKALGGGM
jgi:multidrug efflux system outer membrane protein